MKTSAPKLLSITSLELRHLLNVSNRIDDRLFDACSPTFYLYITLLLRRWGVPVDDVDDLASDGMLVFYRIIDEHQRGSGKYRDTVLVKNILYGICLKTCKHFFNRPTHRPEENYEALDPCSSIRSISCACWNLTEALLDLDERTRRIIAMRYFLQLTQEEVGSEIGISARQVRRLEKEGLKKLKGIIKPEYLH
jgi:RNA polymerase sigma factor (sigma-70 family)